MPSPAIVGRTTEQAALAAALADALAGDGRLVMLTGEAGMGKSLLAEALAERAGAAGAGVAWGRAWESAGAPAYWPWVELLRGLLALGAQPPQVARAPLARLVRELADGDAPPAAGGGSLEDRFELFDAVAAFVAAAAAGRAALVLLLDDLHAADVPSLLLLRALVPRLRGARVLVVAGYREEEVRLDPERALIVAELARAAAVVELGPLSDADAAALVEGRAGTRPSPATLRALADAAGGNPLFLAESARLLGSGPPPGSVPVPARLRDVVARRIGALPRATAETLATASVIGREFGVGLLAGALERDPGAVLRALDPAIAAGIAEQRGAGLLRFSHALVRDALYAELPASRRAELHHRVGVALERAAGDDAAGERLSALAHHFLAGGDTDAADRGIDYAQRAGERAQRVLAFEEAVASYELAAAAAAAHGLPAARRCELALALGGASWRAGDARRARAAFAAASELATALGDGERLARAALGFGEIVVQPGAVDRDVVALLEAALAGLPDAPADRSLRPALLGRLARELHFAGEPERRGRLAEEAVALARAGDDPAVLARALGDWHVAEWAPDNVRRRLEVVGEIVRLAKAAGDRELLAQALAWRAAGLLEAGEVAGFDRVLEEVDRVTGTLRQPVWAWHALLLRATQALLRGRYEDARRLARSAHEHGRDARGESAAIYLDVQELARRRDVGGLDQIEPVLRRRLIDGPPAWQSAYVSVLAELGRLDEVRAWLGSAPDGELGIAGRDTLTVPRLVQSARAAELAGDTRRAAPLYERLAPYADLWNVIGVGGATSGSVQRTLGVLATLLRRHDAAERHLRAALAAHERAGARPWVARTQHDYARLLLARGRPGDAERAERLLDAAAATAGELGMEPLRAAVEQARARRAPEPAPATLAREGEYWAIAWGGRLVRVRDSKGVRHLARLLGDPHAEIPARVLVAAGGDGAAAALEGLGAGDDGAGLTVRGAGDDHAGELLDAQARSAYRARAAELEAELERARRHNDPERAELLRAELDELGRELARAVGLGGRARHAASATERARLNATRAIRTAIRRIGELDPRLGAHLEASVRTGSVCRYAPAEPVTWRVSG